MPRFSQRCLPTSHLPPLISHLPSPTSHLPPPISHLSSPTSHLPPPISHLPSPTSHLPPLISHLSSPTSHLPPPISHLPSPTSHLPPPISHLPSPTSHLPPLISHLSSPTSHLRPCGMWCIPWQGDEGFEISQAILKHALLVPGASYPLVRQVRSVLMWKHMGGWYDKSDMRAKRKMGHVTVVAPRAHFLTVTRPFASPPTPSSPSPDMRAKRKMGHVTVVAPTVQEAVRRINAIVPQAMGDGQAGDGQDAMGDGQAGDGRAPQVAIIMGSDSDLPVMKGAAQILDFFQVPFELTIVSAHRTPDRMFSFAQSAHTRGIRVIIAGAGGAAHLPGMVASMSPLPVIGVPVKGSALGGMDSLLSIVQMPRGIPVATVAINNAVNAALLAVRMLGASDPALLDRHGGVPDGMVAYQKDLEGMVLEKAGQLETDGWEQYLNVLSSD
ncbi:unnamed protein product [Closterium sp. NIES-64]|nr:unnamed protein product [Closterium sp. NIES-64]